MLQSMTGFGKASGFFGDKKIRVELRSLNSKNFDFHSKIPSLYKEKEIELRNIVSEQLNRGKVECFIVIEESQKTDARVELNTAVLAGYYKQLQELGADLKDGTTALLPHLLSLPDAFKSKQNELSGEEWKVVLELVADACKHLQEFRGQEGAALQNDFLKRLSDIRTNAKLVKERLPERKEKVISKLRDAINTLQTGVDENRFEQELIYYLEKLDISEEEVRLENHLSYFEATMQEEEHCGRKLGFICQEMGREINTMGSKANDAEIQKLVVLMKDDLEKIKEQVLNVL
ncbi:YicC/YloC family endoribonuclease [Luteibaculum oceani]|uniref:YicC family protein n=1 Tax=Luteibaculum oceani TaxID=1294296 RepID=A0A5C6VKK4_9FLAO|nr:YicC/YloC family endoribonuclease [Luteibaculum oceani]TXC85204.1 YicC family protein [Luteibaculum oceani]